MVFNTAWKYQPSDEFLNIREKIINWNKMLKAYEGNEFDIESARENAMYAAQAVENNFPGKQYTICDSILELVKECESESDLCLLYIHGGGFIAGSLDNHRPFAKILSKHLNAHILMIDYPLAPENPFPIPFHNCVEAYKFLNEFLDQEYSRKGIIGDSAGANLALSTSLKLRDENYPLPDFCILMSGFFDLSLNNLSVLKNKEIDIVLRPDFLQLSTISYAGTDNVYNPYISPIFGNFSNLCPLFFQVGSSEMLLDDTLKCHKKALESGVNSYISVWPEMIHSFQSYYNCIPESRYAIEEVKYFIETVEYEGC